MRTPSPTPSADLVTMLSVDRSVPPAPSIRGGTTRALAKLDRFLSHAPRGYATRRNHPECDGASQLSPYLNFGHIGPHTVALAALEADVPREDRQALLEELIVRRELAINFARYNHNYDRLEGCEAWAKKTLNAHARDRREHLYSAAQFERAETHDPLWNAAQRQMLRGDAWAIGGKHDRAWGPEGPVYGLVRSRAQPP